MGGRRARKISKDSRKDLQTVPASGVDLSTYGNQGAPSVSIILPVRNEERYLEDCLKSLLAQDYSSVREILVFDGNSTDGSRKIVQEIARKNPIVCLIANPKIIQAVALNMGIRRARGDIIVRVDAHALYEPDYVSQCVYYLKSTGGAAVGGPMRPISRGGVIADAIAFCHSSRFGIGVARFHDSRAEGYVDTVWLGAFWKSLFAQVGLFNEEIHRMEDTLFNHRLRATGHKIFLTPKIKSWYFPRNTLASFLRQAYKTGFVVAQTLFFQPAALSWRHFAPLAFTSALLALCILSVGTQGARLVLMGVLILHLGLGICFSLIGLRKYWLGLVAIMPIVFFSHHVAYGMGTIWGIARAALVGRSNGL